MDSSLPSDTAATTKPSEKDVELQRKRARDRKSQQAMRDRTRWTIQTLTDQVAMLSAALEEKARHAAILETQVAHLTGQNMQLHKERVSMELSMLDGTSGVGGSTLAAGAEYPMSSYQDDEAASQNHSSGSSPMSNPAAAVTSIQTRPPLPPTGPWEISPANSPPSCLADEMLQRFVDAWRSNPHSGGAAQGTPPARLPSGYALRTFEQKPDFESVFPQIPRHNDGVSHLVSDIVKTCYKINGWPQHVALFYIMSTFVNWMLLLDKKAWDLVPDWLRPIHAQLSTTHHAWIDRIPWPRARQYLIAHPEITLADFAKHDSPQFSNNGPAMPLTTVRGADGSSRWALNPAYESHVRQLRNWTVGASFKQSFPELWELIRLDWYSDVLEFARNDIKNRRPSSHRVS